MDLRLAFRRLRASPGFTIAAVLTLALGIGANALTFSAIRALLVRPLPFPEGDSLVWVQGVNPGLGLSMQPVGGDEVQALAASLKTIEDVGVIGATALIRANGERRDQWRGLWVTANALPLLQLAPALGRTFTAADMQPGTSRAAMIGYERWQRDFGSDPGIVGRVVQFEDKKSISVIGVLPRGLEFPTGRAPGAGTGSEFHIGVQDFWMLGQSRPDEYPGGVAFARLRRGASVPGAQAEAATILARVPRKQTSDAGRSVRLISFRDHALGVLRPALPLLEGFAALVLLIAGANLANLVLARALKSRGEFAVRTALGASRVDLVRAVLAETIVIAAAGAAAGLAIAALGRTLLVRFAGEHIAAVATVRIDTSAIAFATVVSITSAIALALLPMTVVRQSTSAAMLERGTRGHTIGRRQTRTFRVLVIGQVAVTLVLLNAALLVFRSLSSLMSVDTGYQASRVIAADVLLYEPPAVFVPYFRDLHERLSALPGVEAVGLVQSTPLTGKWTFRERLSRNGAPQDGAALDVAGSFIAFDYFKAMGIPLLAGRDFTSREFLAGDQRALIINDVAADQFFPGQNAVGRELVLNGRRREIVGVVKGTRDVRLETAAEPQFYQPAFTGGSQVIVRVVGDPDTFASALRRELTASDPRLMVRSVQPLTDILESAVFERRLATRLLAAFAGLALTLAIVGLYGVLTFTTVQRQRELGVRAALGARPMDLVRMILAEGFAMTFAGVLTGAAVSIVSATWLRSLLYDTSPRDPASVVAAVTLLALTALIACAWPSWRAASVPPAVTLRAE